MPDLKDVVNIILKQAKGLSPIDWVKFFVFVLIIPLFLRLLHFLSPSIVNQSGIASEYFVLIYKNPTLSGCFLSNYFHSLTDPGHISSNYVCTILIMLLLGLIYFIAMPAFKIKNAKLYVASNLALILLLGPFFVSFVSMYLRNPNNSATLEVGFSGLSYALLGLTFFLILFICFEAMSMVRSSENYRKVDLFLISFSIILIVNPYWKFFSEIGGGVSGIGHMAGYSFGLITAIITSLLFFIDRNRPNSRANPLLFSLVAPLHGTVNLLL